MSQKQPEPNNQTLREKLRSQLKSILKQPTVIEKELKAFDKVLSRRAFLTKSGKIAALTGLVSSGMVPTAWANYTGDSDYDVGAPEDNGITLEEQASESAVVYLKATTESFPVPNVFNEVAPQSVEEGMHAGFESFTPFIKTEMVADTDAVFSDQNYSYGEAGFAHFTSSQQNSTFDTLTIFERDFVSTTGAVAHNGYRETNLDISEFSEADDVQFKSIRNLSCAYHNLVQNGKKSKRLAFVVECSDSSYSILYNFGDYDYGAYLSKAQLEAINQQEANQWVKIPLHDLILDNWEHRDTFLAALHNQGEILQDNVKYQVSTNWTITNDGQSYAVFSYMSTPQGGDKVSNASGVVLQITPGGRIDCRIFHGDYDQGIHAQFIPRLLFVDKSHGVSLPYYYWLAQDNTSDNVSLYTMTGLNGINKVDSIYGTPVVQGLNTLVIPDYAKGESWSESSFKVGNTVSGNVLVGDIIHIRTLYDSGDTDQSSRTNRVHQIILPPECYTLGPWELNLCDYTNVDGNSNQNGYTGHPISTPEVGTGLINANFVGTGTAGWGDYGYDGWVPYITSIYPYRNKFGNTHIIAVSRDGFAFYYEPYVGGPQQSAHWWQEDAGGDAFNKILYGCYFIGQFNTLTTPVRGNDQVAYFGVRKTSSMSTGMEVSLNVMDFTTKAWHKSKICSERAVTTSVSLGKDTKSAGQFTLEPLNQYHLPAQLEDNQYYQLNTHKSMKLLDPYEGTLHAISRFHSVIMRPPSKTLQKIKLALLDCTPSSYFFARVVTMDDSTVSNDGAMSQVTQAIDWQAFQPLIAAAHRYQTTSESDLDTLQNKVAQSRSTGHITKSQLAQAMNTYGQKALSGVVTNPSATSLPSALAVGVNPYNDCLLSTSSLNASTDSNISAGIQISNNVQGNAVGLNFISTVAGSGTNVSDSWGGFSVEMGTILHSAQHVSEIFDSAGKVIKGVGDKSIDFSYAPSASGSSAELEGFFSHIIHAAVGWLKKEAEKVVHYFKTHWIEILDLLIVGVLVALLGPVGLVIGLLLDAVIDALILWSTISKLADDFTDTMSDSTMWNTLGQQSLPTEVSSTIKNALDSGPTNSTHARALCNSTQAHQSINSAQSSGQMGKHHTSSSATHTTDLLHRHIHDASQSPVADGVSISPISITLPTNSPLNSSNSSQTSVYNLMLKGMTDTVNKLDGQFTFSQATPNPVSSAIEALASIESMATSFPFSGDSSSFSQDFGNIYTGIQKKFYALNQLSGDNTLQIEINNCGPIVWFIHFLKAVMSDGEYAPESEALLGISSSITLDNGDFQSYIYIPCIWLTTYFLNGFSTSGALSTSYYSDVSNALGQSDLLGGTETVSQNKTYITATQIWDFISRTLEIACWDVITSIKSNDNDDTPTYPFSCAGSALLFIRVALSIWPSLAVTFSGKNQSALSGYFLNFLTPFNVLDFSFTALKLVFTIDKSTLSSKLCGYGHLLMGLLGVVEAIGKMAEEGAEPNDLSAPGGLSPNEILAGISTILFKLKPTILTTLGFAAADDNEAADVGAVAVIVLMAIGLDLKISSL
ncbi:hypothetical protein M9194_13345 [Vibrio sp. S4M6]|uniref:hypothetical protein n=1 Tax=Vibrio sinus TaxID=2946865 RepID=UPI00202AA4AF|nr:hypothetical protein [Vibrio sinus]MCL9782413.1 hypothetical protein [Vibrio sinus]